MASLSRVYRTITGNYSPIQALALDRVQLHRQPVMLGTGSAPKFGGRLRYVIT